MSNTSQPIRVIHLASVNLPTIRQDNFTEKWVPFGASNDFPNRVNEYESFSSTHKPILNFKSNMIAGKGLISTNDNAALTKAIKKLNPKERSYKTLKKLGKDYAKHNGFAIQVLWNVTGDKIAQLHRMDFSRVRSGVPDKNGEVKAYYYSRNWKQCNSSAFKPVGIPVFDPSAVKGTDKDGKEIVKQPRQIYYYYEEEDGIDFYPVPSYNSCFPDLEFDYQYGMFKANTMRNGMFASCIVHYNFEPTEGEKDAIEQRIREKLTGTENAGRFVLSFGSSENGQKSVEVTPLNLNSNADLYKGWKEDCQQNIVSAHQLSSPVLAGIAGAGGLGGNAGELLQAFMNFQDSYVNDAQSVIVDVLKELLTYWPGLSEELVEDLDIATKLPFTEIPQEAYDVASDEDIRAWLKERYGLEFKSPAPAANPGANPAARTPGQPPAIAKAG